MSTSDFLRLEKGSKCDILVKKIMMLVIHQMAGNIVNLVGVLGMDVGHISMFGIVHKLVYLEVNLNILAITQIQIHLIVVIIVILVLVVQQVILHMEHIAIKPVDIQHAVVVQRLMVHVTYIIKQVV